ncbi:hypothetical protein [Desulforhopalus singaporensis]|uniref:Sulfotransferase family protein n=1 Tax=Desulforhopalus singaporensis TaxID=91360 RepID=A0A1H0T6Z9_9BACT|nr:hypothetical protein [Desulforhopalus singaporensis]SDP49378.1 hypothetical protein SAMN05660330_02942 [Desulforhopalus singaporensis]
MKIQYKYAVDVFKRSYISGWCFHRFDKKRSVVLEFYEGDKLLGKAEANQYREDLKALNVHPDGKCGFCFFFPGALDWETGGNIVVRVAEKGSLLASVPKKRCGENLKQEPSLFQYLRRRWSGKATLKQPIFFMHIPKTAGTTFNTFVENHFKSPSIRHIEVFNESEYSSYGEDFLYIAGHVRYSRFHRYFPKDKFLWYSLLREPYAHLHSHLNWLRSVAVDQESDFYRAHNDEFRNISCHLSGKEQLNHVDLQHLIDTLPVSAMANIDNQQTRYFLPHDKARIEESDAHEALDVLRQFNHVGLTEDLIGFQQKFLAANHAPLKPMPKRLNKAKLNILYNYTDPEAREIAKPLVSADLHLYNSVVAEEMQR